MATDGGVVVGDSVKYELTTRKWVIPYAPPSLNRWQDMHWAQRRQIKADWYEQGWMHQNTDHRLPPASLVVVSALIVFRRRAHRDLTNYEACLWKIVPDMLMEIGVLADDTEEFFRAGGAKFHHDKELLGYGRHPAQKGVTVLGIACR